MSVGSITGFLTGGRVLYCGRYRGVGSNSDSIGEPCDVNIAGASALGATPGDQHVGVAQLGSVGHTEQCVDLSDTGLEYLDDLGDTLRAVGHSNFEHGS